MRSSTPAVPAPTCSSYLGGDIWFSVTVPANGSLDINTQTGNITDGGMAVYTGTCNALTQIACDDDNSPNGLMPELVLSGLTAGAVVYIRLWEYGNDNNGTFGICITSPTPPPPPPPCLANPAANDFCATATPICNLNGFCGNTSASYTATGGGNLTTVFCGSIENNSWLSFVANATTATLNIWVSNCALGYGIQMQIYSTNNCTNFTSVSNCWNPGVMQNGTIFQQVDLPLVILTI